MYQKNYWRVKPIKIHFGFDTDRDGVRDRFDCRPFNPRKQHVTPNKMMMEEIKELPIYVTDASLQEYEKYLGYSRPYEKVSQYHVLSKEAKQKAPVMRRAVLSILKRYPNIIGLIKQRKPKYILFTKVVFEPSAFGFTDLETKSIVVQLPSVHDIDKADAKAFLENSLSNITERYARIKQERFHRDIFQDEPEEVKRKKSRTSMAGTTFHELKHIRQVNEKGWRALQEEYKRYPTHGTNPFELEAHEEASRQLRKRDLPNKGIYFNLGDE